MEYQAQGEPMHLHNKINDLESELARLRAQLAEAQKEREFLMDGNTLLVQHAAEDRDRADAAESALAASEAKRKVLARECRAARCPQRRWHKLGCVCVDCEELDRARAATDAACALEGE